MPVQAYLPAPAQRLGSRPAAVPQSADPPHDRPLFLAACLLLATYFYEIPVLRTPLGMLTWLRLDDFATVILVLGAVGSAGLLPGITRTFIGRFIIVLLVLIPISILLTFLTAYHLQATQRGIWTWAKFIQYFVVFALVSRMHMNRHRLNVLLAITLAGCALNGLVGIAQYYGWLDPGRMYEIYLSDPHFVESAAFYREVTAGKWARPFGLFTPNYLLMGEFMCCGVAFFLVALSGPTNPALKIFALFAVVPIAAGLILSGSRTGVAIAAVFAIVYVFVAQRRFLALFLIVFAVAVSVYFLASAKDVVARFEQARAEMEIGAERLGGGRIWLYHRTLVLLAYNPDKLLFGYGMASWFYNLYPLFGYNIPHSMYVLLLAECGLPGLLLWLLLQVAIVRFLARVAFRSPDRAVTVLGRCLFSLYLALLVGCFTYELLEVSYAFGSFLGFLQLWLGVAYAAWRDQGAPLPQWTRAHGPAPYPPGPRLTFPGPPARLVPPHA